MIALPTINEAASSRSSSESNWIGASADMAALAILPNSTVVTISISEVSIVEGGWLELLPSQQQQPLRREALPR
jgi:hypothetical protein